MDRKEIFRKRLAVLLSESGLTQAELAEKLNRTQSLIGSYLAGRRDPSLSVLIEMANIFQVDLDYLVGRDGNQTIATHSEFDDLTEEEKFDLIKFKIPSITEYVIRTLVRVYSGIQGSAFCIIKKKPRHIVAFLFFRWHIEFFIPW